MPNETDRSSPNPGRRQVLVVEDEIIIRELLEDMLRERYDVIQAGDGNEAMELLYSRFESISLVLLDLIMPRLNGFEVLRMMREDEALQHIPVIVMTSDHSAEVECLHLGAVDFIPKPYPQRQVLLARVDRIIELSEDRQIIRYTERDRLTGLYNRDYFYRYAVSFDLMHRDDEMDAIVLDVNHFRLVNERYGTATADNLLRQISAILLEQVRPRGGIVCRRGADTFLVYCPHGIDYQKLLDACSVTLPGSNTQSRLRLRMGIYPKVDKSIEITRRFDRAKLAADTVRGSYNQPISFYDSRLHQSELYHEQLLEDFPAALEQGQFQVWYQPKFDVRPATPLLSSAEALVRWEHPKLGLIHPDAFIPLLENKGLISQLDRFVWQHTAEQICAWKKELGVSVPVSVNVSRLDLYDSGLKDTLLTLTRRNHLSPTELLLEITESAYTQDTDQIVDAVNRLRALGFQVEMDDFGTGYSSLNMLSTLPIDALKLDTEFVRNAFQGSGDLRMLEVVMDLARYLDVPTIAEGVERAEQLNALRALGCDYVQGFCFSPPLCQEDFQHFLLEHRASVQAAALHPGPNAPEHPHREGAEITRALSSGFESVYYVDAGSGRYVEFSAGGRYRDLEIQNSGSDFFSDCQRNLRRVVCPEDQALVASALDRERLLDVLSREDSFTVTYRLLMDGQPLPYTLRASRAAGKGAEHLVIGVGPAARTQSGAAGSQSAAIDSIARSLSSDFAGIYYVNLTDDTYQVFTSPGIFAKLPLQHSGRHFFQDCQGNIHAVVHYEDQPRLDAIFDKTSLLERLDRDRNVIADFRMMIEGKPVFFRMKINRDQERRDHIVIGISDVSVQHHHEEEYAAARHGSVTYSLIAQALSQDYYRIFYVNADTGHFIEYSNQGPSHRLIPERSGDAFFTHVCEAIRVCVLEEDREKMCAIFQRNSLLTALEHGQRFTMVYRRLDEGQIVHISLKALRLAENDPHLVIGLRNVEAEIRREQEYQAAQDQRAIYSRIARALSHDYFSIYYVDIRSDDYVEYSSAGDNMDPHMERRGSDFFTMIQERIKERVYQQDQAKTARAWQKDTILSNLERPGSHFFTFRRMVNGQPLNVRFKAARAPEDENHVILAVSNVDAEMRREQEYLQAQEMALRDDLTAVRNKRAFSQAQQTLDHSMLHDPTLAFSVVVCDVNDLKLVNDTQGHSAGDQYLRTAAALICNTFVDSPVFRIGGDEFVALLLGQDYDRRADLMAQLSRLSAACQSPRGLPIFSCGISDYMPGTDRSLSEIFQRADEAMYQQKAALKARR